VPVEADEQTVAQVFTALADDPDAEVVVDVAERTLAVPSAGIEAQFPLPDFTRWRLLEGLDDIALTLRHADSIIAYEAARASWLPALGRSAQCG
jgi:3-isopropylmalate/(R)-2-methylmalate dehydratase small subunit